MLPYLCGGPARWPTGWAGQAGPVRLGVLASGGDQADPVSVVQEHGQGAAVVLADADLAEPWVVASDGALIAGLQPGVRVTGVIQGDPVAALVAGRAGHRVLRWCAGAAWGARSRAMRRAGRSLLSGVPRSPITGLARGGGPELGRAGGR